MFSRSLFLGVGVFSILLTACQKSDSGSAATPEPAPIKTDAPPVKRGSDEPTSDWVMDAQLSLCRTHMKKASESACRAAVLIREKHGIGPAYQVTDKVCDKLISAIEVSRDEKMSSKDKLRSCVTIKEDTAELANVPSSLGCVMKDRQACRHIGIASHDIQRAFEIGSDGEDSELSRMIWSRRFSVSQVENRKILSIECREMNPQTGMTEKVPFFSDNLGVQTKYLPDCQLTNVQLSMGLPPEISDSLSRAEFKRSDMRRDSSETRDSTYFHYMHDPFDLSIQTEFSPKHMMIRNTDQYESNLPGQAERCLMAKSISIAQTGPQQYTMIENQSCEHRGTGRKLFSVEREIQFENNAKSWDQ